MGFERANEDEKDNNKNRIVRIERILVLFLSWMCTDG